jgi:glycosyltransferase involved in cell wall biosynthesis
VHSSPDIAVLASFSGEGGVERMLLNLVNEFAARGLRIDLVLIRSRSKHLNALHPGVRRVPLGTSHTGTSLLPLVRYLRANRPPRMLVAKDRAGRLAIRARRLAATDTRLVLRLGTNLSEALKNKNAFQRWLRLTPIRRLYPKLEHIIAVSEGVAEDTRNLARLARAQVSVVRNPVITPELARLASQPPPHEWLREKSLPVILAAGRLTLQKDFTTLLHAFHQLRRHLEARLIILGEGEKRESLEQLVGTLNLEGCVDLPGFTPNPFAFMAAADLFVLSSRWEGSPNVLTEALALDTPVVATDCPSGPNEILEGGRIAPLVPVGDPAALAEAMRKTLINPPPEGRMQAAAKAYEVTHSANGYLSILFPPEPSESCDPVT